MGPLALALALCVCACAPRVVYQWDGPQAQAAPEGDRAAQAQAVWAGLLDEGAPALIIEAAGEQRRIVVDQHAVQVLPEALATLPMPVLAGLRSALTREHRGMELDLLVPEAPEPGGASIPVSVLREPDRSVVVRYGAPWLPREEPAPDEVQLRERFGIAGLVEQDAPWSPRERAALAEALDLLDPLEREVLEGVPLVRVKRDPDGRASAVYVLKGGDARVEVYDATFEDDRFAFCGDPAAPRPMSVFTLVHEIGHAVASYQEVLQRRQILADAAALRRQRDEFLAALQSASVNPAEVPRLEREAERLLRELGSLQEQLRQLKLMDRGGPVVDAYEQALAGKGAPTPYGRRGGGHESFADAFALARADPQALRRVNPRVLAFFLDDGPQGLHQAMRSAGARVARQRADSNNP